MERARFYLSTSQDGLKVGPVHSFIVYLCRLHACVADVVLLAI